MLCAVNIIGMYVTDPVQIAAFYAKLGFKLLPQDGDERNPRYIQLGGLRLQFINKDTAKDKPEAFQKDAFGEPKGTGLYINIEVTRVDEHYRSLVEQGIQPRSEPRDWPWGQREFVVRDPDGYKLVFYERR